LNSIRCDFSAGIGRTGVFIALCNLIERVRVEGFVDVFQVVRELRTQRSAMVQTKVTRHSLLLAGCYCINRSNK